MSVPARLVAIFDALADRDYDQLAGSVFAFADGDLVEAMVASTGARVRIHNCIDPAFKRIDLEPAA